MNTSIETADLNSRSVDFSNIAICFFHIPLLFLATLTDLDLSGTLIEALGLTIVSRWCTELLYLALRRCINLSNEVLNCLSTGFGELFCLDLSENNFLNKETLRRLLEASPRVYCLYLVEWDVSFEDQAEIVEDYFSILPFMTIFAKNGGRILEIEDY